MIQYKDYTWVRLSPGFRRPRAGAGPGGQGRVRGESHRGHTRAAPHPRPGARAEQGGQVSR